MPPPTVTRRQTVRLLRSQHEFGRSQAPFRGYVGGRGSGKSRGISYDLVRRAKRGRLYMMASPTYTILADTDYRMFCQVARELNMLGAHRLSPPSVKLTTGAEVIFRSADNPENLRGPNLSGVALNEASLMKRDAYDICIASLREGGEQGWLSAGFTPKGLTHWTYEVFGPQPDTGRTRPDVATFYARTADNVFLPPGFADTVARQYAGRLALQELEGRFVAMEGADWPAEWFGRDFFFADWPPRDAWRCCTFGVDPSKGHAAAKPGDYAAISVLVRTADGKLWADCHATRDHTAEQFVDALIDLWLEFKPDAVGFEENSFQYLFLEIVRRRCRELGVFPPPVVPLSNRVDKVTRIRRLGNHLMRKELRLRGGSPGAALMCAQMRDFPAGEFDDAPDSLEMARRVMVDLCNSRTEQARGAMRLRP